MRQVPADREAGPGLLTVQEAAHELRMGYRGCLAAIHRGQLPGVRIGKAYRLRAEDVRAVVTPPARGQEGGRER